MHISLGEVFEDLKMQFGEDLSSYAAIVSLVHAKIWGVKDNAEVQGLLFRVSELVPTMYMMIVERRVLEDEFTRITNEYKNFRNN